MDAPTSEDPQDPGNEGTRGDPAARGKNQAGSRRSIVNSPFFWATVAGLILIPLMRPFLRFEPPPPPVLAQVPAFTLTDSNGEAFGSADLAGEVYVTSFFFTRCASICPLLTTAMASLNRRYDEEGVDGIRLISITVDPDHDTPERLREYRARHGIDGDDWVFLTGNAQSVRNLVVGGFKTAMGSPAALETGTDVEPSSEPPLVDIAHSGRLVLVDARGGIRGYYDIDVLGLDEVFHRSQHVLHSLAHSPG